MRLGKEQILLYKICDIIIEIIIHIQFLCKILFFSEDGRKCRTTVTMEGDNKLITEQVELEPGTKCLKIVREFSENQVYLEMICEDVVSKQLYLRQI